jgi:3-methylcrotonyl-CoA carboxylase alpha subunit
VIEESPSPVLTPALRAQMGEAAVRLARAIGYVGAGTVEFIATEHSVQESGSAPHTPHSTLGFAFLEMNTRLQVEHGVTELVTGLDLVQLQLRVAAGEALPFSQADVRQHGHAIQCRIYAEDAARGYLPSSGRLARFRPPAGAGVRHDLGVYEGFEISSYYDPMLAKLLVWGEDRATAIARAAAALDGYEIEGVATNLPLLRAAVRHPEFAAGRTYTSFLEAHVLPALSGADVPEEALLCAAAHDLLRTTATATVTGPWALGPWRQSGIGVPLTYRYNGTAHTVSASRLADGSWDLTVGGQSRRVALEAPSPGHVLVRTDGVVLACTVMEGAGVVRITRQGQMVELLRPEPPSIAATEHAGPGGAGPRALTAPLAGVVVKVSVAEGDHVDTHQPLVILEAMKMEHTIDAPSPGVVARLHRAPGDRVQAGDILVELTPE